VDLCQVVTMMMKGGKFYCFCNTCIQELYLYADDHVKYLSKVDDH
jgi:hypothetical protein